MRIGLNLLYSIPGVVGGTEVYGLSLLHAIAAVDTSNEYVAFINRETPCEALPQAPNFTIVRCPVRAQLRSHRYFWEQAVLPLQARYHQLDVLHSLGYVGPIISPCTHIITMHDANFLRLREYMPAHKRLWLGWFCAKASSAAHKVITVSEFSRSELCSTLGIRKEKVVVIHEGPGQVVNVDRQSVERVRRKYNLPPRYIAAFGGGGSAHKNIETLLSAFSNHCEGLTEALVLIGRLPGDLTIDVQSRIRALGRIPACDVGPVLAGGDVFVLPSLYEGFGLPVLEAQLAGVPVLCSNVASLPEIAGDGAAYFDPRDPQSISRSILHYVRDKAAAAALKEQGRRNAERFSWSSAAKATVQLYSTVANQGHQHDHRSC